MSMQSNRWRVLAAILLVFLCLSGQKPMAVDAQELKLTAQAAVLMEACSGEVIYELNMHEPLPMASLTRS